MQNIVWKVILILLILAFCGWTLAYKGVRLGKDLKGGTSLVYLVKIPDEVGDKQGMIAQTIDVLKERVNPQGVLDISMQPLGVDRIEIVMPLPGEEVLALKAALDAALADLLKAAELSVTDLDEALRLNRAPELFGSATTEGGPERQAQFQKLQEAYNNLQDARAALNQAEAQGVEADALILLQQSVAEAQLEYEDLRDALLRTSIDRGRIVRTLSLPKEIKQKKVEGKLVSDEQGRPVMEPSQREVAIANIKQEFPHLAAQLDATIAAYDAYQAKRTTLDDPEDLMRLLKGAGVLEFYIAVDVNAPQGVNIQELRDQLAEKGPENTDSTQARWFPINELKQWYETPAQLESLEANPEQFFASRGHVAARFAGQYYLLLYTTPAKAMTHGGDSQWTVEQAGLTQDQLGRPAVSFRLDPEGGRLMGRLTGAHVNQPMAIVLDGQVYSAPNINEAIGSRGIIQGDFSQAELTYLLRVLAAGALEARLSEQPISMNTLGPSLGADNLRRGMWAFVLATIVTAAIMLGYYFVAGLIANFALMANVVIIFGVMALIDGTFTLPGLAGIALSIAMAVDANVLIYERIREELINNKEDLRTAIRLGYRRAMSAIIDGNVTGLITCVVLLYTATTEVKGFALTMILGTFATLFTALVVTRMLFTFYTEWFGFRSLPMLPTVFPAIHRALEPHINWISKRHVFFAVSIVACVASLALVFSVRGGMLDTEFRGGVSMTMETRLAQPGEPADASGRLLLSRPDVAAEIHRLGAEAGPDQAAVQQLADASVLTVGEMTPDFKATRFQVKVGNPPNIPADETTLEAVQEAIVDRFHDRLDVIPALKFDGLTAAGEPQTDHTPYTFPIREPLLGANIARPEHQQSVAKYEGGVAVVIENVHPPVTEETAYKQIDSLRQQTDFSDTQGRQMEVIGLDAVDPADPSQGYTSLAVVVFDKDLDLRQIEADLWNTQLAAREWDLIATALARGSSLQEVASFSPAIARTLATNAGVAIVLSLLGMLVYIWVRFGSLRYSVSTVVAVTHNVIICLGALALTHYVADTAFARWLVLDEFRIDLNVIAALLTIIGYSLNDTIVILDRIRENRGKRLFATPEIINTSINQTFSRTVLTGGSTIIASIILYSLGGTGIRPFAFTFLIGLMVGTYSSVAIAAPLVAQRPSAPGTLPEGERFHRRSAVAETVAPV